MTRRLPTIAAAGALSTWFVRELRPSQYPQIFIWSGIRFGLLLVLLGLAAYFVWSCFRPRLLRVNNYLFFLLLVEGIGLELVMRAEPSLIVPSPLFPALPEGARRRVGNIWGFYTKDSVTGNAMIFRYKPHEKLPLYPYVRIDQNGYRNPIDDIRSAEVVLLGDSMTAALASQKDLGDLFRERGHTALNLAMGNYMPQLYRDTYRTWVIEKRLPHSFVFIFLAAANDFSGDVTEYANVAARGGDYTAFLSAGTSDDAFDHLPWVFSLAHALPAYAAQRFYYARPVRVDLPYETIRASNLCPPVGMDESSVEWPHIRAAVDEIVAMARGAGAKAMFFLVPTPATVYSKFSPELKRFDRPYAVTSATLAHHFEKEGVSYIDLSDPLKREVEHKTVFAGAADCHFNTNGVETTFQTVWSKLYGPAVQSH